MEKVEINLQIVNMRKVVRQARILILRRLIKYVKMYKEKRGATKEAIEKRQRKVDRLMEEIKVIKKMPADDISEFCLRNTQPPEELLKEKNLNPEERAFRLFYAHKIMRDCVEKFRATHPDWEAWMLPILKLWHRRRDLNARSSSNHKPRAAVKSSNKVDDVNMENDDDDIESNKDDDMENNKDNEAENNKEIDMESDKEDNIENDDEMEAKNNSCVSESVDSPKPEDSNPIISELSITSTKKTTKPSSKNNTRKGKVESKVNAESKKNKAEVESPSKNTTTRKAKVKPKTTNAESKKNTTAKVVEKTEGTVEIRQLKLDKLSESDTITELISTKEKEQADEVSDKEDSEDDELVSSRNPFKMPWQKPNSVDEDEEEEEDSDTPRTGNKKESRFDGRMQAWNSQTRKSLGPKGPKGAKPAGYFKKGKWRPLHRNDARPARDDKVDVKSEALWTRPRVRDGAKDGHQKEMPKQVSPKSSSDASLHPSWEAKRKLKEKEGILQFKGKKVVFD